MRSIRFVAVTLVAGLAACGAESTAPAAVESFTATADGVSSPNTPVTATVVVSIEGTVTYRESGPGNRGGSDNDKELGECRVGGTWYNPKSKTTSANPHPNCRTVSGGTQVTVVFAETANHVVPPSGNVQLNFAPDCSLAANPLLSCGRGLSYKKNADATTGSGRIVTTEPSTGEWTIDFAHPVFNNTGNLIIRAGTAVVACHATLGCHPGTMSW